MSQTLTISAPSRTLRYVAWGIKGLLALAYLAAAGAKLAGAPMMVEVFHQIGLGQWFRIVTGIVEIVGVVGLFTPGLAGLAALWLGFTMVCAIAIHIAILHTSPAPAVVLLVLDGVLAGLRRDQIAAIAAKIL